MEKVVVLLSGGLDSVVNLAGSLEELGDCLALTFDYGQEAARAEVAAAAGICSHYGVEHRLIDISWLLDYWRGGGKNRMPGSNIPLSPETRAVWVPNRNGLLVNAGAAVAEGLGLNTVVIGINREEAEEFPDNSRRFLEAVNDCLSISTATKVKAISFTVDINKEEIGEMAKRLDIPWRHIWSCYEGGERMCGECASCRLLKKASRAGKASGELEGRFEN